MTMTTMMMMIVLLFFTDSVKSMKNTKLPLCDWKDGSKDKIKILEAYFVKGRKLTVLSIDNHDMKTDLDGLDEIYVNSKKELVKGISHDTVLTIDTAIGKGQTGKLFSFESNGKKNDNVLMKVFFQTSFSRPNDVDDTAHEEALSYSVCIAAGINCPVAVYAKVKITSPVNKEDCIMGVVFKEQVFGKNFETKVNMGVHTAGIGEVTKYLEEDSRLIPATSNAGKIVQRNLAFQVERLLALNISPNPQFDGICSHNGPYVDPSRIMDPLCKDLQKLTQMKKNYNVFFISDLKPANWMYDENNKVWLVDFLIKKGTSAEMYDVRSSFLYNGICEKMNHPKVKDWVTSLVRCLPSLSLSLTHTHTYIHTYTRTQIYLQTKQCSSSVGLSR